MGSAQWLRQQLLQRPGSIVCVDASWFLPNSPFSIESLLPKVAKAVGAGASGRHAFLAKRLPGSVFLDLDRCADMEGCPGVPHMAPQQELFEQTMQMLNIRNSDTVVCYDRTGTFSAPRAYWTFKLMGHENRFVLDGGLPAWEREGYDVVTDSTEAQIEEEIKSRADSEPYSVSPPFPAHSSLIVDRAFVAENAKRGPSDHVPHIDVRPAPRFTGEAPEPREGMRSGHAPGCDNIPFLSVLDLGSMGTPVEPEGDAKEKFTMQLKTTEELAKIFETKGLDLSKDEFVISCGSGMTAAIVGLAAEIVEPSSQWRLYDGSWSDYGRAEFSDEEAPVVKG